MAWPESRVSLPWLTRLRWGAVLGQAVTVAFTAWLMEGRLDVWPLAAVIGATALSNLAMTPLRPVADRHPEWFTLGVLVLDTLLLTLLLAFAGGAENPFCGLYVVHVTLGVVVVGGRAGALLLTLSAACYAGLFMRAVPLPGVGIALAPGGRWVMAGHWASFLVAGMVIAYFVSGIGRELRERDRLLAAARERMARGERLASLSTLAAGAAHELGTPLATIAVVAKELERSAAALSGAEGIAQDARLMRDQVERCRTILRQMSVRAGQSAGEMPADMSSRDLSEQLSHTLGPELWRRVQVTGAFERLEAPPQALVLVITSLIRNALDASEPGAAVGLWLTEREGAVLIRVEDHGHGMPEDVLSRAGEPFFTTKPPGRGTGLGLFLARDLAERLGGRLELQSRPGLGTTASLELPVGAAGGRQS